MTKTKLLHIALAASLAFNLFFIAGFFVVKHRIDSVKTAEGRAWITTQKLRLNASQSSRFVTALATIKTDIREAEKQKRRNTARFEMLLQNGGDIDTLREAYAQIATDDKTAQEKVHALWQENLRTWNREQKSEFNRIVARWPMLEQALWIPETAP